MIQGRRCDALEDHGGTHGVGAPRPAIETQGRHLAVNVDLVPERGERLKLYPEFVVRPNRLGFPAAGIEPASIEPSAEADGERRAAGRQGRAVRVEEAIEQRQADRDGGAAHHAAQDSPAAQFQNAIHFAVSSIDAPLDASIVAGALTR